MTARSSDQVKTAEDIDARVCVESPPEGGFTQQDPDHIVLGSMVHGPSGARNPGAPCMQDAACAKE